MSKRPASRALPTPPTMLTPAPTGGSISSSESTTDPASTNAVNAAKKARRQTAFYPNMNQTNKPQKPFSRSAAKRESVMALGSIEHLQHYFTKTGLSAKPNANLEKLKGLVPAIGGRVQIRINPASANEGGGDPEGIISPVLQLPPSPEIPQPPVHPSFSQVIRDYETDPEYLLPGVIEDLIAVSKAWNLAGSGGASSEKGEESEEEPIEILSLLKITTRAIRSVRNYVLSLPDESTGHIRAQFRARTLGPRSMAASSSSGSGSSSTSNGSVTDRPDPLTLIRRDALEVLTVLRDLEEKCRLPLSDDAYDAQSDGGHSNKGDSSNNLSAAQDKARLSTSSPSTFSSSSSSGEPDPQDQDPDVDTSIMFSLVQVPGRYESVPVWLEENDVDYLNEEDDGKEKKELWDERLVLGGGWLYKQDIKLSDLEKERKVVGAYLDVVDEALFNDTSKTLPANPGERGWERESRKVAEKNNGVKAKRRRVSAGDVEPQQRVGLGFHFTGDKERRRVSMINMGGSLADFSAASLEVPEMSSIKEESEHDQGAEESLDEDELPEWARKEAFMDSELDRAYALITSMIPSSLQSTLPSTPPSTSPESKTSFLSVLSSGQVLCIAYNTAIRKSKQPWGYVNRDSIHDIASLEREREKEQAEKKESEGEKESRKKSWTFRRIDNLRLWVGGLKLRYLLPIIIPAHITNVAPLPSLRPTPSQQNLREMNRSTSSSSNSSSAIAQQLPSPTQSKFTGGEPAILFDAKIVARKEDDWEEMLERLVVKWVGRVVNERRMER